MGRILDTDETMQGMSLDEKLSILTGQDAWSTVPVERLGVDSISVSDGPHGLRKVKQEKPQLVQYEAVAFPTYSALAATWNTQLAYEMGKAVAGECIEQDVDIILGPGVNIKRTPQCGRNFEYFSEDPYLAGKLALNFVNGVQSRGIGTSLKHFALNNQEADRFHISSEVDDRTLREIYLYAFEETVKKAKPYTVMCAYNKYNGIHCSRNKKLLDDILRKEWGFDGVVISDWDSVHDRTESLRASLELEMPFSPYSKGKLKADYDNGLLTMEEIDRGVRSILKLVNKVSESFGLRARMVDDTASRFALSEDIAREAITLLKNDDYILPVTKAKYKKVAVIGGFAKKPVIQGGGSSHVTPIRVVSPYDGIMKIATEENVRITYGRAYNPDNWSYINDIFDGNESITIASEADMVLLFVGENDKVETEGVDRPGIRLHAEMERFINQIAEVNDNVVVVLQTGSAVDVSAFEPNVKGIVWQGYLGGGCGNAIAEVLFGRISPSGKLAETFPMCVEDTPTYSANGEMYPGNGLTAWYKEGILVGYRHYDKYEKQVMYPFGHGLSYGNFVYTDLKVELLGINEKTPLSDTYDENGRVRDVINVAVTFKVKNAGYMTAKETVQVYVRDVVSNVLRPEKELKGFTKVELKQGEEKEVRIVLGNRAFAYYSTAVNGWMVENGAFDIMVGASSRNIILKQRIVID